MHNFWGKELYRLVLSKVPTAIPFCSEILSESDMKYSQVWWPILWTHALHLPIQVHTHSSEHTHCEHTLWAVGSNLCCSAWGVVGCSVPCSRAPRRGIKGGDSAVHSLPPPTIPAGLRLELATFRLWVRLSTIRPRLPQNVKNVHSPLRFEHCWADS